MYCILDESIGLRSWNLVPYAYYRSGERNAKQLTQEAFELLVRCDGLQDIEDGMLLRQLESAGLLHTCERGEYHLLPWQKESCNNRYFPAMNWMITERCNFDCLHCFNAEGATAVKSNVTKAVGKSGAEWTLEEAEQLLDEAKQCQINAITLTGGEPMLHKNFFEILAMIYERKLYVEELNTNGYYITQERLDKMKRLGCNPLIKISFDGLFYHDWLRNKKGAEASALQAIRICVENGFRVKVQTNVHRRNANVMLMTAETVEQLGAEEMRIIRTSESPRWRELSGDSCLGIEEYYEVMLAFMEAYCKQQHSMNIDVWQFMGYYPKHGAYAVKPICCAEGKYCEEQVVCRGNRGMVAVAANGNLYPCMQLSGSYDQHGIHLGNVKKEGLQPLLTDSSYLEEVCTTVGVFAEKSETCGTCEYFRYCCGGCRAIAFALTQDRFGPDPAKCIFFRQGYYKRITDMMSEYRNLTPANL